MKGGKGVREMQRAIIFVARDENNSVSGRSECEWKDCDGCEGGVNGVSSGCDQ